MIPFSPKTVQRRFVSGSLLILGLLLSGSGLAQTFDWAPGYPVGSMMPVLEAPDQDARIHTLETLTGETGLVLVIGRSFDWCPWCKAQLQSLVEVSEEFSELGFGIATMTYDATDLLKLAEEDFGVDFPLLQDENRKHFEALGILNPDYAPGEFGYGIARPGIMLIDPEGVIRAKFAEENHRVRPDWSEVLEAAEKMAEQSR